MYELPSQGRRVGPALIALLVVLAGVAGTMGYLVARQIIDGRTLGADGPGPTSPETVSRTPTGTGTATQTSPPTPGATGRTEPCPKITIDAVQVLGRPGNLTVLLYFDGIATRRGEAGAEVWICEDSDGALFYQGHRKTGPFGVATGEHTLLLGPGVRGTVRRDDAGFVAVNPNGDGTRNTEYHVSREQLRLVLPDNSVIEYNAARQG